MAQVQSQNERKFMSEWLLIQQSLGSHFFLEQEGDKIQGHTFPKASFQGLLTISVLIVHLKLSQVILQNVCIFIAKMIIIMKHIVLMSTCQK